MSKRPLWILLIVALFLVNGFLLSRSFTDINRRRIKLASNYYEQAQVLGDQDKLYSLIMADLIAPESNKKLEIANLYIKLGDFDKANFYFGTIKDQSGILRSAETALEEGRFDAYEKISAKITNTDIKAELNIFKDLSLGKKKDFFKINSPRTNLGKALNSFATREYSRIDGEGAFVDIINQSVGNAKATTELKISKDLLSMGQYEISAMILNRIATESPELIDSHLLLSRYYELNNEPNRALDELKLAIKSDPSRIDIYKEGVRLSRIKNDPIEQSFFENRLKALEQIIE